MLPHHDLACWNLFVKACSFLCRKAISQTDIEVADKYLIDFLNKFEALYGKQYCTINLHLHAHLAECLKDFGPVYCFWLFLFERMNGILGSFKTNSHDISVQLTRRYLSSRDCSVHYWPKEFNSEFSSIVNSCVYNEGSLSHYSLHSALKSLDASFIQPLSPLYEEAFDQYTKEKIISVIRTNTSFQDFQVLTLFEKSGALKVGKFFIGSLHGRFSTTSVVKAECQVEYDDGKQISKSGLAEIHHFAKCTLLLKQPDMTSKTCALWLAAVSFFDEHQCRVWFGSPTEVWGGVSSTNVTYILVSSIVSQDIFCKTSFSFGRVIGSDSVMIISPID